MADNPISTLPAAQTVAWTGRSSIASSADGYLELKDSAGTAFTGLRFGGTSSSFPMLKRSSATLQARLADDSGYAAMAMGGLTVNGTATVTASANSSVLASTGYSLTGSNASAMLDLAGTWNTSGNATLIKANVTNTASGSSSMLMDLQVGGSSKFAVRKDGVISVNVNTPFVAYSTQAHGLSYGTPEGVPAMQVAASSSGPYMGTYLVGDGRLILNGDTGIYRDGSAYTVGVRAGANAHKLSVYRTWTDASNYERVALQTGSGYGQLAVESAGTGTANMDLALTPAGTGNLKFGTHSAIGAETVTGYITIKDSGGTTRKLAVVS